MEHLSRHMARDAIIDALFADSPLFETREECARRFEGYDLEDHYIGQELVIITIRKGPEVHFYTPKAGKTLTWSRFRDFMQKVIDEHGYLETWCPKTDARQQRFNKLIGFEKVGENEFDFHYRIEKIRGS